MIRYSERLHWTAPENPQSRLLSEMRQSGRKLLDLSVSNPTDALTDYPHAEIADALGTVSDFGYQPQPFGDLAARNTIAGRMESCFAGLSLPPAHLALTASTSEAYGILFKLLANPGDEVLVPMPSYPLFEYLARLEGVVVRPYRLAYDGSWYIDFESLEAAISTHSRAIVLVNPNNPTGSFLKRQEWPRLREIALAHALPLISDEVFVDYAFGESAERMESLATQSDVLSFTLNGLSKSAAMPQMKLGWIAIHGPQAECEQACSRLELVLDTYLPVGAPVQRALKRLLVVGDALQHRIRIRSHNNLMTLCRLPQNSAVHCLPVEGGWSAILRVPAVITEEEWIMRLLREQNVIVQPGYFFDMPGEAYLVVSLLTEERVFTEGIKRLLNAEGAL